MADIVILGFRAGSSPPDRPAPSVARRIRRTRGLWFKIRQLTDVFHCKLQHHFSCKRYRAFSIGPELARELPCSVASALSDQLEPAS